MRFALAPQPFALALALGLMLAASAAPAQSGGASAPSAAPPAAAPAPLRVWVDAPADTVDAARLRDSLASELKREVVLATEPTGAELQVRLTDATHADVKYTPPRGEPVSRRVELPPDRERSVLVLSWLSVNLVRDEASEVLGELRARRREEEEAQARAAAEQAAADKAAADKAAADKAAADKAAADKAAADKATAPLPDDGLLRDPLRRYDLALATPIAILPDAAKRELTLQLSLAWSDAGAIRGLGVSMGALRLRQNLRGLGVGLAFAMVGGKARGVLGSIGYAHVDGELTGVQLGAGAAFQRSGKVRGVQVAVGGTIADEVQGVQLGAGVTYARSLEGVAASAGAVLLREPSRALVMGAGVAAVGDLEGGMLSAGVTIARHLQGLAIAPVNVQRRVKGLQLGIVNVADELDGAAIGILSVTRSGRVQPVVWGTSDRSTHLAVKSIAGYCFTQLGAGVSLSADEYSYDAGIGVHLKLGSMFFLEPGVHYSDTVQADSASSLPDQHDLYYLMQGGIRLGNKVDLLAAAGLRHNLAGDGGSLGPELRFGIAFF